MYLKCIIKDRVESDTECNTYLFIEHYTYINLQTKAKGVSRIFDKKSIIKPQRRIGKLDY